jgi:Ca-activated chloride channel family protein
MRKYGAELWNKKEKSLDPGNLMIVLYLGVVFCILLFGAFIELEAAELGSAAELRPEEVQRGELLALMDDGRFSPSALLSQKVDIEVSGIIARVKVEQRFVNSSQQWIEALYVFPLPDESAVDHLRLMVGERIITGRIEEKQQARVIYEKARKEGRKSSLLSQQRANIFTTRVANIGPGETIVVEIEYQQTVAFESGTFSLRFPMVVGPRYIPGRPLEQKKPQEDQSPLTISASGWAKNSDQVPDASEITPPVDLKKAAPIGVELSVDLAAGMPLERIESLYHGIDKKQQGEGHYLLHLTGEVLADRDFVLEWRPRPASAPVAALFGEKIGGKYYQLLMLVPPEVRLKEPVARELIFILDISGSMAGTSIVQAKAAISLALKRLRPEDRFNLIVFNDSAGSLFVSSKPAEPKTIAQALGFVAGLEANGGTEMKNALNLALDGSSKHQRLRQVVFLTDGAVGNDTALLELIARRLGDSRLFTVGIGSAPNGYFMSRAARLGRGSHTYIGSSSEVETKMMGLFTRIENPVLSDLQIGSEGQQRNLQSYPSPLPDLYLGEPLVVAMASDSQVNSLQVSGMINGQPWQREIAAGSYGQRPGVGTLWARKKIRSLMEQKALGGDEDQIKKEVVTTALEHHLVSRYTSLVAVDDAISRPAGKKLNTNAVKTQLPAGWKQNAVFGGGPQTGTSGPLQVFAGILILLFASLLWWRSSNWR